MPAADRDSRGVAAAPHDPAMTIQLDCPWCQDEVTFTVDETDDEMVCAECNTRMTFAPDPVTTFGLLYEPAA
jgi:hypothetical protein